MVTGQDKMTDLIGLDPTQNNELYHISRYFVQFKMFTTIYPISFFSLQELSPQHGKQFFTC